MIFGSVHNVLHKIKHKALLNRKRKKENKLQPGEAQPKGPQAGPSGRCARPRLHSGVADCGPPLSASPSSSGRPNRRRDRAIHAILAPRDSLVVFSTSWRTSGPPKHSLSPSLASTATGAADGHLGRANAGHYEQVERELSSA